MTPRRLRLVTGSPASAETALADRLPDLDTKVYVAEGDSILLPPLMWQALEREYGAEHLTALLASAGLQDAGAVSWAQAARWGMQEAGSIARSLGGLGDVIVESVEDLLPGTGEPRPDWHLDLCKVRRAWQLLGTDPQAPRIDWQGLRAGHVDTGYTEHPAFGFPAAPWIDIDAARTFEGNAVYPGAFDPMRGVAAGHGTGSGSLCNGCDPSQPYLGVAPRLPLVPVHVADCYILDQRAGEFEAAVHYLVDEVRTPVISVSMGTFLKRQAPAAIARAVDHCYAKGVIMVAAAGNVPWPGWPAFPAALPRAIAVAGITQQRKPWAVSSSGDWVDFSAPAKEVPRAAVARSDTGLSYGYAATLGGTTFATAMTAGAAALWLHRHAAELPARYRKPWQVVEAFRVMARRTASVPPGWRKDAGFGSGILDVAALMDPAQLPNADDLVPA